ncbi:MAG TPA: GatB/YqeY domain-containing protein [Thermoanaerobaculia bacterium]|nr:GatB/YqeY domain-containing protein [Thermoanaerobaculia bacterium]
MSTPQERVEHDVRAAMKSGDKERLGTLRMLLSEVKNERIRRGGEVDEAGFVAVVRKGIKQRHESAEQFRRGGREDAAAREEREAELLGEYLPRQASEDEVRAAVRELIAAEGLSGPAAMGRVMKETLARFGSRADGATVSRIAREVLTS